MSQVHITTIPSIDVELARRLVADQFPHYASLPLKAVEPGGWDNRTFRLGEEFSVRLPSAGAYAVQVGKEHRWLPRLAPHLPLPIPVPHAIGSPGQGYPWPWSIYHWLDGEPANSNPVADQTAFAQTLARFLGALHRIDAADGPAPGQHNFHRGDSLAVYDGETRAALSSLSEIIDVPAARDAWEAALSSTWEQPPVWVHGDVAPGNLLVKDGALHAVIDFGCSAVGDPACDLVMAWTAFSGESRAAFRAALDLDDDTWARARGWALWKAVITIVHPGQDEQTIETARHVVAEVVADHGAPGPSTAG